MMEDEVITQADMDEDHRFRQICRLYNDWRFNQTQPFPSPTCKMSIPQFVSKYSDIASGCVKLTGTTRCDQPDNNSNDLALFRFRFRSRDGVQLDVLADQRTLRMKAVYFSKLYSYLRTGIAVAVSGFPGKTENGDLYVLATEIDFNLAKATKKQRPTVVAGADRYAAGPSEHIHPSEHDLEVARKKKIEVEIEKERKKEVYRIRSKFVKHMRKFLYKSKFMKVKTQTTWDMLSCMNPDPKVLFDRLLHGVWGGSGFGNHFRNRRVDFAQKDEFIGCEFFKSFKNDALMELTEQMLSGIIKELTGGYKIKYNANGLDKDPIEIDFSLPFRRIDLIEELEKTANLNLPEDLSSDSTNVYLSDACNKYGIECPLPRTTWYLLNKLVEKFVEVDCINPTFIINHPNFKLPYVCDAGLTDRFELFINKDMVCSGDVVLEDPKILRKIKFPSQYKVKAPYTSLGDRVELCRTGWWLWALDRVIMMLTDKQDIKEVDCSIYRGPAHKKKKKNKKKQRTQYSLIQSSPSIQSAS